MDLQTETVTTHTPRREPVTPNLTTWSNHAQVVYLRTYSRNDGLLGRETWHDTVERVIAGNVKNHNVSAKEVERLQYYFMTRKATSAGRGLWYSGTASHEKLGGTALSNCFGGNEEFITSEGLRRFKDVVGKKVRVLDRNRSWVETEVQQFGEQEIVRLTLTRYGKDHVIETTAGHRWEARRTTKDPLDWYRTENLPIGSYIPSLSAHTVTALSHEGIAHGITFGDGSRNKDHGCNVTLCGEKIELKRFFSRSPNDDGWIGYLPDHYKTLPDLSQSRNYLAGFFAGLLATDGCISHSITISNRSIDVIKHIESLCAVIGVETCEIREENGYSNFTNQREALYVLPIPSYALPKNLVLRSKHLTNFVERERTSRDFWKVASVETTGRVEPVFCVQVPTTHTFTLKYAISTGNCWFLTADSWENLPIAMDLLMLGGGVGLSVESQFVQKLPKVKKDVLVKHESSKDAYFIVPDNREGWCALIRKVLKAYFVTGKSFDYSTYCIRGAGELIKGFGGTASGPRPLIRCVENICSILNARVGKHVRPIDVADLMCAIGEMVKAGNVRRSAIMILGDAWDKLLLRCKRWDLGVYPSYRASANYSVVAEEVDDLHPDFWKTYEVGEPFGLFNRKAARKYGRMGEPSHDNCVGLNPCQPEFATVLTPNGISTIGETAVGSEIWSGSRWTKVVGKIHTGSKEVLQYQTTRGNFVGTEDHRVVQKGSKIEVKNAESIDWCLGGMGLLTRELCAQDVMDGLVVGDGSVHTASGNLVFLCIGANDTDYFTSEVKELVGKHRAGLKPTAYEITTTVSAEELPKTYFRKVPDRFFRGDASKVRGFLRGLFSANGSVVRDRITLKQSSRVLIDQVQQMLSAIGIASYITTNREHDVEFGNGTYRCRESYDLNVSTDRNKFVELIGFIQQYKMDKIRTVGKGYGSQTSEIQSVQSLGVMDVYDITVEADEHTYWSGGLLVSNCGEATLESGESCVRGDTTLITRKGAGRISELVGQPVEVWNGGAWAKVQPFVAAKKSGFYRVEFSDGSFLDATPGHRWLVKHRFQKEYAVHTTTELIALKERSKYPISVPRADVRYIKGGVTKKYAYEYGFFAGDGYIDKHRATHVFKAVLFGRKMDLPLKTTGRSREYPAKQNEPHVVVRFDQLEGGLCHILRDPDAALPDYMFSWSRSSILRFIAGWIDADGSSAGCGTRLYGCEKKLRTAQLLLTKCGVDSSINLMSKRGDTTNYGTRNRDVWYLQIPNSGEIPTHRVKSRGKRKRMTKGMNQVVVSITKLGVVEPSYCLTEPKTHRCLFGNVLTLQCNLQEIAMHRLEGIDEFVEASKLMHRWGKRVTMEYYHHEVSAEVIARNRRVGTGITGCLRSDLFNPEALDRAYAAIQEENEKYSKELGIPKSIRTTVVKPSGTMGKVMDADGYEGIHPAYSKHFIQRVRFGSTDSLLPYLKRAGHTMELEVNSEGKVNHETVVVDFYCKAPEGYPIADEQWDTWKQLETLKMAQRHWSDQAVSVTVYYRREEIPQIKEWLRKNLSEIKTISFLCHSEHGFKQAPKEAITADQYETLNGRIKPLDIDVQTLGDGDIDGVDCVGGVCPVK
jgi:hypothetical protein